MHSGFSITENIDSYSSGSSSQELDLEVLEESESDQQDETQKGKPTRWQKFNNWWSTVPVWKKVLGVIGFTAFVAIACTGVGLALELTTMGVAVTGASIFTLAGSAISGGVLAGAWATTVGALLSVGGALLSSALAAFYFGTKPSKVPSIQSTEDHSDYVILLSSSHRKISADIGSIECINNNLDLPPISTTPMLGLHQRAGIVSSASNLTLHHEPVTKLIF